MALLLVLFEVALAQNECKAVAFQSGGSFGAFEAGVVKGLYASLPVEEIQWDILSGISAGAINAGMVARFEKGEEKQMVDALEKLWLDIKGNFDFYIESGPNWINRILVQGSIFNTDPEKSLLERTYNDMPIKRNITIGVTDFNLGTFLTYNETLSNPEFVQAVMGSSAVPIIWPLRNFDGRICADGGTLINIDIYSAINRCLQITNGDQTKVTADMIMDIYYDNYSYDDSQHLNTFRVIQMARNVAKYSGSHYWISSAKRAYPKVNFRYIIKPLEPLPFANWPFEFLPDVIRQEIDYGYEVAVDAVKNSKTYSLFEDEYEKKFEHLWRPHLVT